MENESTTDVSLEVKVGSLSLRSPLIAASGTCGFGKELADFGVLPALGAFVTKTVTLEPREGNPPPRIFETPAGLINSIGLANPGYEFFQKEMLPEMTSFDCPFIVNIGGKTEEDFVHLAELLSAEPAPAALELNLSCPNVTTGGMDYSRSAEALARITRSVKKVWDRPLFVKLTPNVTDITQIISAAAENGADAAVVANTYLGMSVDWRKKRSRIGRPVGGLSGPAIKPITLRLTHQAASSGALPIISCGGIVSAEDVLDYFVCGSCAVQIGSGILRDPLSPLKIKTDIERLLSEEGIPEISNLTNTFTF